MSELCCKFQIPALNNVGGVAETIAVVQSVTDVRTDKVKTTCPSPIRGAGEGGGWGT